jgi:hypothetical protein
MYADDAAIFLKKTSLTPISCNNIDLDSILADFPVSWANFPINYLGLPLTPRRLKKLDFQPLLDKAAGKLSAWNGRNLTQAGRVCLTKLVLSSQPVYHLTVLKPPLEVMQELDKIRRRFLWAGDKAISGGKCKVNLRKKTPFQRNWEAWGDRPRQIRASASPTLALAAMDLTRQGVGRD